MNSERVLENKIAAKEVSAVSLSAFLLGRLLLHKDKHLVVDCPTGCWWSGKELHDSCISIADAFINKFDLNTGDTVCFWCPTSDVSAIGFLATISSGATYVAVDPDYSFDDVYRVVKLSAAKFLVCSSDHLSEALQLMKSLKSLDRLFVIGDNWSDSLNCHSLMRYMRYKSMSDSMTKPVPIPVPVDPNDLCVIHFTKQTKDGIPSQLMPIITTHANLVHSSSQLHDIEIFQLTSDDCIIGKHFSDYFGIIMFCHSLVGGTKIALTGSPLNKQKSMQFIKKYNITSAAIDLQELFYLLRNDVEIRFANQNTSKLYHDFSTLTDILHTGSPLPHSDSLTEEVFRKIGPKYFRAIYCKPETGVICCVRRSSATFDIKNCVSNYYSVGHPVPGVQVKVIHPQTEKSRSNHKIGEICVKSKQMIEKNRNLSLITRNAFTIDGYFKTGDAGFYDTDGALYIECRVNELIYEDNDVINPSILESLLIKHSAVKDVAVIGIPDPTYGQMSCAFVVLEPKQFVSEKTLLEFIANRRHKHLRAGIKFIDSMPRTFRNQVNRMALRMLQMVQMLTTNMLTLFRHITRPDFLCRFKKGSRLIRISDHTFGEYFVKALISYNKTNFYSF